MLYGFTENFVLPLSHDEVVHGKGSMVGKMPGDEWQKFANLRRFSDTCSPSPARSCSSWAMNLDKCASGAHDMSLEWHVLQFPLHSGVQNWVEQLNRLIATNPRCMSSTTTPQDSNGWTQRYRRSVISLLRKGKMPEETILMVCNFTPVPRQGYRVGVPSGGFWKELLNSDAKEYGGSGQGNLGGKQAEALPTHGRPNSISLTLPPLGVVFLKAE